MLTYTMRVYFIHPHYILENNALHRVFNPHKRISVFSIPENSLQKDLFIDFIVDLDVLHYVLYLF